MPFKRIFNQLLNETGSDNQAGDSLLKEYRNIFENSASVMLVIDPEDGRIIDANTAACRFYHYDKNRIRKMKIMDINTMTRSQVIKEMDLAREEKRGYFNFRHRLGNDEIRDVEVYSSPISLGKGKALFSIIHDISERKRIEREKEELINKLGKALEGVRVLSGLLPICSSCKKIRDDQGYWQQIEAYIGSHASVEFTHSICPECIRKLYPEMAEELLDKPNSESLAQKERPL